MNAVEFTTELSGAAVLPIPREIAAQLPKSGKARIIVLTEDATDEAQWRAGAYEQFLRDDLAEDAVYDSLRGSESHPRPLEPVHLAVNQKPTQGGADGEAFRGLCWRAGGRWSG
jgi:hypothetical protein